MVEFFTSVGYKMLIWFIGIIYTFTPYAPPVTTDTIEGTATNGSNLTFVAWGDSQFSNYIAKRIPIFDAVCEDLENAGDGVDALLIAGDITENALGSEYFYVTESLARANVNSYIMATGNHDVRFKIYKNAVKKFTDFTNKLNEIKGSDLRIDSLHYKYEINGYPFLVLGTDKTESEEAYLSDEQLSWLDSELEAADKTKPVFVICHQTIKRTHGLPETWWTGIKDISGSVGKQSDKLEETLNKYSNVIMISGHLHTGIGEYTYEKIGNIHSVNLPSVTINNKQGNCNDNGIGFVVEVYDDEVLFRARNFASGIYLPEHNITISI